jgi:hypothetical protein
VPSQGLPCLTVGPISPAGGPRPRTYNVKRGDPRSGIGEKELGDVKPGARDFKVNRDVITSPDYFLPAQVLVILASQPARLHR